MIAPLIEMLTQVVVPVLVALIAAFPLWMQVRATRKETETTRLENARDHAFVRDELIGLKATTTEALKNIRDGLDENSVAIRDVDDKVGELKTEVRVNRHRINYLEDA